MSIFRTYGENPYVIVVVHGGPGAGGEMAPIGRRLSKNWGIYEPIQTKKSIQDQIQELKHGVDENCQLPIILIGYSWGAWLTLLFTAKYGNYVKKVILIGSGPFEEAYVEQLRATRMNRLSKDERQEFNKIILELNSSDEDTRNKKLTRLGQLASVTDDYNPMKKSSDDGVQVKDSGEIYQKVWGEAAELRKQGQLIESIKIITCPITALHGDYDPHPYHSFRDTYIIQSTWKSNQIMLFKNLF